MDQQPTETDIARLWRESGQDHAEFARLLRLFHQPPLGHPERLEEQEGDEG